MDAAGSYLSPTLARYASPGASVVVAGCGAGSECRNLASAGFRVLGLDFSEEMIGRACEASAANGALDSRRADLRHPGLPASSCALALFTPDVYSFIPERADRVESLRQLGQALHEGGALFVSARVASHFWSRGMVALQWCASRTDRARGWGSSHTRWVGAGGRLRCSFIQLFSERQLAREFSDAGLCRVERVAGWRVLQLREHLPYAG